MWKNIVIQTSLRAMAARNQHRFKWRTKAATVIQVEWRRHRAASYYKKLRKGGIARRELRKLKMEARETGALKEAKNKLEKQLEELTWRLQLEKRLRTDLEEAKTHEISKLQASLQTMKCKIDEANATLVKEREAAKKAIEEAPPVIKETQIMVEDTTKIDSLNQEVQNLKISLQEEKERANGCDRKLVVAEELSEERHQKLDDSDKKIRGLQDSMHRLEEKLINLESENQVLRQQAVSMAPNKLGRSRSIIPQRSSENVTFSDSKPSMDLHSASMKVREYCEPEDKPQKSLNDKQQENQDVLIRCISQHLGFTGNKPIAACIIYKCLLQWRSFEVERTTIFDRIIQTLQAPA